MTHMNDIAWVDVETTGLDPVRHEIVDIWVVLTNTRGEVLDEAGGLVLPRRIEAATPRALEINCYSEARWAAEARPWAEVWAEVEPLIDGARIAGHKVDFDLGHLTHQCEREGTVWPPTKLPHICTLEIARAALPRRSHRLWAMCNHFGISNHGAHSARADAYRALNLWRALKTFKEE
uniref:Putative exonuclease n=1 Tax=viral metagenome TaxID=1070528 RepID=A0A6M3JU14_9ZZZZ